MTVVAAPLTRLESVADQILTVPGQTCRNTAARAQPDPIETPLTISVVDSYNLEARLKYVF